IALMGIAPLFVILTPIEIWFRGWRLAFIHLTFALALSLLLLNLLLVWFRKIPFTCSYFPGKTSMAVMAALYLAGFTTYSWTMASVEESLLRVPAELTIFYTLGIAALYGLWRLERREVGVDD